MSVSPDSATVSGARGRSSQTLSSFRTPDPLRRSGGPNRASSERTHLHVVGVLLLLGADEAKWQWLRHRAAPPSRTVRRLRNAGVLAWRRAGPARGRMPDPCRAADGFNAVQKLLTNRDSSDCPVSPDP